MNTETQLPHYLSLANTVRGRIARIRLARGLRHSHLAVGLVVLLVVLGGRWLGGWREGEWMVALGLLGVWVLAAAAIASTRLPATAAALRQLDQAGGWKDRFASAWEFLGRGEPSAAEHLHLERSGQLIDEARAAVPGVFPVPSLRRAWILPLLAFGFSLLPWGRQIPDPRDLGLTAAMQEASREESENLRREAERVMELEALSEEEQKELESLRAEVDSVAEALADPEGLTAGEMLEALDEKARAAEKLAEKLGSVADEWASAEMLAEMANHADTADLSLFIGEKSAEAASSEAAELAATLKDPGLSTEVQERYTRATDRINAAARDEDHVRPVGERFGNAARKLIDGQPQTASREFEELSKWFLDLAGREKAKDQLEKLAESLREAGGEIGNSELKKMEQMANASSQGGPSPEGMQAIDSGAAASAPQELPGPSIAQTEGTPSEKAPIPGQAPAPTPGEGQTPAPESIPGNQEGGDAKNPGEQAFSAPVPGEKAPEGKSGAGLGQSDQSREGKGKGGMLSAPIPGMDNGAPVPGAGLAGGDGQSKQSGTGGDQAGTGTAEMIASEGEKLKAGADAKVVAQAGKDGDSSVRAVEGEVKAEKAERSRQDVVADFIAVEEQALDEESLPMSRRRHVLRYFTAIRKQFEQVENAPKEGAR